MKTIAKHPLVEQLDHAEWALVQALNATTRPTPNRETVESLKDRLQMARKACIEAGLDGRTFMERVHEFVLEQYRKKKEDVRAFAELQTALPERLPRRSRLTVAAVFALSCCGFLLVNSETTSQMLLSILGASLVFTAGNFLLSRWFPTRAVRVGNHAADLGVDVRDLNLYQEGTGECKDYLYAAEMKRILGRRHDGHSMMRIR